MCKCSFLRYNEVWWGYNFLSIVIVLFVSASVNESKEWAPPQTLHFCEAKQKNHLGENVPRILFSCFWKFSHRFWNNCDSPTFIEYFLKILKYSKCWAQFYFFSKKQFQFKKICWLLVMGTVRLQLVQISSTMPFTHTQSVNPKLVLNQIHTYHRSKDCLNWSILMSLVITHISMRAIKKISLHAQNRNIS